METNSTHSASQGSEAMEIQEAQASAELVDGLLSEVTDNLRQALGWSLELAPQVMANLISRALQSIDRQAVSLEGASQAQMLAAASARMEDHRSRWIREYPALLRIAMAYPAPSKLATILPQVDLRICEQETAALEAAVQATGSLINPLSPASYVQALLELLARSEAEPELRQIWIEHLLAALSSQLAWVYLQLLALLRDPNQREASSMAMSEDFVDYAAQAYGLARDAEISMELDQELDPETRALAEQARKTVLRLRKHLDMPEDRAGDLARAMHSHPVEAMMQDLDEAEQLMALIQQRGLPMPDQESGFYDSQAQPDSGLRQLEAKTSPFLSIESQIDELLKSYQNAPSSGLQRMPEPLAALLMSLKPAIRIMVQEDDPVLSDETHPARQLLQLISQRSLRYSHESAQGFADFLAPIEKLISAIAKMQYVNARVFEKANDRLKTYWQQIDSKEEKKQAAEALRLEQMQAAKQLAGRLGFGLIGRKDASDAPQAVKQFLMGPWAIVLAYAQIVDPSSSDHERYTQAVSALLWSVSARRIGARKAEHLALIAQLMPLLKNGLQSIYMPEEQAMMLLNDISKLHEAAQASKISADAQSAGSEPIPRLRV